MVKVGQDVYLFQLELQPDTRFYPKCTFIGICKFLIVVLIIEKLVNNEIIKFVNPFTRKNSMCFPVVFMRYKASKLTYYGTRRAATTS